MTEPETTPSEPADPVAFPEQPPMDDAAGGPDVPTEDKPEDADSAAHPS